MQVNQKILELPVFNDIDKKDVEIMLDVLEARICRYEKGEAIVNEGDDVRLPGIIICGNGYIVKQDYEGNRNIISEISIGEMFGEALYFSLSDKFPLGIYAGEGCEVMYINLKKIFLSQTNCELNKKIAENVFKILSEKTLKLRMKINIMSKKTIKEKLMTYLFLQYEITGKREFDIPFDRQQLADYLGVDRSALSSQIGKLVADGTVLAHKNHFKLLKLK